jgi:hypothetical protein
MVRGSKKLINEELILRVMLEYFSNNPVGILILGNGAIGVDKYISQLSQNYSYQVRLYFAEITFGLIKSKAEYTRDKKMIDDEFPDILFVFPSKRSKSIYRTIRYAQKKGVKVVVNQLD